MECVVYANIVELHLPPNPLPPMHIVTGDPPGSSVDLDVEKKSFKLIYNHAILRNLSDNHMQKFPQPQMYSLDDSDPKQQYDNYL